MRRPEETTRRKLRPTRPWPRYEETRHFTEPAEQFDVNPETHQAVTRAKGISGNTACGKTSPKQLYRVQGSCAVSAETGSYP